MFTLRRNGFVLEIRDAKRPMTDWVCFAEWLFGGLNTFSITLRPDGTHRVDFGSVNAVITMTGRSPGGGASNPGETDISTASQPLGTLEETVYEEFDFLGFDLSNTSLEYDACGSVVGIEQSGFTPASFALLQSRPNPFRSSTTIAFDLPEDGRTQAAFSA